MQLRLIAMGMAALLTVTGCGLGFDEVQEVKSLRVLAVQAEPPEIAPGDGTSVTVLWADPLGKGREVDFVWWICAGFVFGADLEMCEMIAPPVRISSTDGGDRLDIPMTPEDILENAPLPAGMDFVNATFVGLLCADGKLPSDAVLADPKGYDHIDNICKGGEAVSFFRTVLISESDNPQENPWVDRVMYKKAPLTPLEDGGEPTHLACKEKEKCKLDVPLKLFMTEGSEQLYEVIEYGEVVEVKETLFVSWYVTGGAFEDGYRSMVDDEVHDDPNGPFETVWQPEEPGAYTLYAVAHDVRGGASWQTFSFDIDSAK